MDQHNKDLPDLLFKEKLDAYSESFCAAKWYNSTIWLGAGQTTSCHHPPSHKVPSKVVKNPKLLHNTKEKKHDRKLMLKGKRPKGCDYCWKVQDQGAGAIPDRVYKSHIYTDEELQQAFKTPVRQDVALKTLEISFDRTCNFACSYCNPGFSTTWVKDIQNAGPYKNINSDDRHHFTSTQPQAQVYEVGNNPLVNSFWQWWDLELKNTLKELRVTGGEPTMSPELWVLFKKLKSCFESGELNKDFVLSVNTNLGMKEAFFQKLKSHLSQFSNVEIYTSCEALGQQAEYIRDGLNYNLWRERLIELAKDNNLRMVNVMCTINALCLESLPQFLLDLSDLRKSYGSYNKLTFTLNILRFPSFQSCRILPQEVKVGFADKLSEMLLNHKNDFFPHEQSHIQRLINYLKIDEDDDFSIEQQDFKKFFQQYDLRRGKSFENTFSGPLLDFFHGIEV